MYPNLDKEDILQAVEETVINSDILVASIEDEEVAKYVAVLVDKAEIEEKGLKDVVPTKTVELEGNSKGKVTVAFLDTDTYRSRRKGEQGMLKPKWSWEGKRRPTVAERKILVALLLREQVRVIITSHLY